jgi:hypothetical protein
VTAISGVPGAETPACPFGDPTCPCQDGDVCHYVNDPLSETMAMTPPAGAETPGQPALREPPDTSWVRTSSVRGYRGRHRRMLRRLLILVLGPFFAAGEWWYRMTEQRADELERWLERRAAGRPVAHTEKGERR